MSAKDSDRVHAALLASMAKYLCQLSGSRLSGVLAMWSFFKLRVSNRDEASK
jgi:hypothetical protein